MFYDGYDDQQYSSSPTAFSTFFSFSVFHLDSGFFFFLFGVTVLRILGLRRSNHFISSILELSAHSCQTSSFLIPAETINHYIHFGNRLGKQLSLALPQGFVFRWFVLGTEQNLSSVRDLERGRYSSSLRRPFCFLCALCHSAYCEDML